MDMITAVRYGSLEMRICAPNQCISPSNEIRLTQTICRHMTTYGDDWNRYSFALLINTSVIRNVIIYIFSGFVGLYDPTMNNEEHEKFAFSFLALAHSLQTYELVVGYIHRMSSRFMDVHCYHTDEADFDDYWSAVEDSFYQDGSSNSDSSDTN